MWNWDEYFPDFNPHDFLEDSHLDRYIKLLSWVLDFEAFASRSVNLKPISFINGVSLLGVKSRVLHLDPYTARHHRKLTFK